MWSSTRGRVSILVFALFLGAVLGGAWRGLEGELPKHEPRRTADRHVQHEERPAQALPPMGQVALVGTSEREPPRGSGSRPSAAPASASPVKPAAALQHAFLRFQFENQPAIDGCLGPAGWDRRTPQPVRLVLRRQESADSFAVTQIQLLATTGTEELKRCLQRIQGRALTLPRGALTEQAEIERVITLLLPSVAEPRESP